MSAAVGFLVKRLTAGRADMPVIRIIAVPAGCVGCMAGGRNHDAVVVGDFILAAFIQEPCAASGAGPIRRVAIFRAGFVLCRNTSQRVADRDLRRGNLRSVIRKCVIVIHTLESVNMKSNFHRGCQAFLRGKL